MFVVLYNIYIYILYIIIYWYNIRSRDRIPVPWCTVVFFANLLFLHFFVCNAFLVYDNNIKVVTIFSRIPQVGSLLQSHPGGLVVSYVSLLPAAGISRGGTVPYLLGTGTGTVPVLTAVRLPDS